MFYDATSWPPGASKLALDAIGERVEIATRTTPQGLAAYQVRTGVDYLSSEHFLVLTAQPKGWQIALTIAPILQLARSIIIFRADHYLGRDHAGSCFQ